MSNPPEVYRLLGDPIRWQIMQALTRSDLRVGELVATVERPQNLVSYHLSDLRQAGLVASRRSTADGRDVYYRAQHDAIRTMLDSASATLHPSIHSLRPASSRTEMHNRTHHVPMVLFVCSGNSSRSQIAEAIVESKGNGAVASRSAGVAPKTLDPAAAQVIAAMGLDPVGRVAKPCSVFARTRFDRVITLCDRARAVCPQFPGKPFVAHWSIPDPADHPRGSIAARRCVAEITADLDTRIKHLFAELLT
jgi:ArsR family transcriptional regulator, arsenate/arsenite/antimonite-responsive transcriptional repressor / arsenate reductase (thioredoxin)